FDILRSSFVSLSISLPSLLSSFFFNDTAPTEIYTLSLHDALPIFPRQRRVVRRCGRGDRRVATAATVVRRARREDGVGDSHRCRSEEHTSELQSPCNLVCRLLLEKKKKKK